HFLLVALLKRRALRRWRGLPLVLVFLLQRGALLRVSRLEIRALLRVACGELVVVRSGRRRRRSRGRSLRRRGRLLRRGRNRSPGTAMAARATGCARTSVSRETTVTAPGTLRFT